MAVVALNPETHVVEPDPYDDFCPTCDAPVPTHTATCAVPYTAVSGRKYE